MEFVAFLLGSVGVMFERFVAPQLANVNMEYIFACYYMVQGYGSHTMHLERCCGSIFH
jgi:hypothetical protein